MHSEFQGKDSFRAKADILNILVASSLLAEPKIHMPHYSKFPLPSK